MIDLPEATFGLIGSAMALLGLIIPRIARVLVNQKTPAFNLTVMTILTLAGLTGLTFFWPIIGIVPVALLSCVMFLLPFFQSHYLNQVTPSAQRATVLSFKGLSLNLAYGLIGILYSILVAYLRADLTEAQAISNISPDAIEKAVFVQSVGWFPWYLVITLILLLAFAGWRLRRVDYWPG
jgi:hypothetical protein